MIKKIFLCLIAAGFLLAAQPAGAFDVGNWFTGRVAALEKTLAEAPTPARSFGRESRSTSLQQVMKHLNGQAYQKKQHHRN